MARDNPRWLLNPHWLLPPTDPTDRTDRTHWSWLRRGAAAGAWLLALLAWGAAVAADAPAPGEAAEVFVIDRTMETLPNGYKLEKNGRIPRFLATLPEGYKVRAQFLTFAPGGTPLTFPTVLTPLNPQGQPDGVEVVHDDWYREPVHTTPYKNGARDGVEKAYERVARRDEKSGRVDHVAVLQAEIPWVNGVLHGTKKTYHHDGKVASETTFVQGAVAGESRNYAPDGKVTRVARYKDGKRDGEMTDYWENGQVKRVVVYRLGQVHGVSREYYLNGKVKCERAFKDNRQHGVETSYTDTGAVEKVRYWLAGEPVEKAEFNAQFKP